MYFTIGHRRKTPAFSRQVRAAGRIANLRVGNYRLSLSYRTTCDTSATSASPASVFRSRLGQDHKRNCVELQHPMQVSAGQKTNNCE